ncbi:MAG: Trk system potassium transporter TrkA [Oscillospiraceae bacterium]|jgi:trk system potassium uptake protein TrkA|nr:Trk system potassium transporter TrkA [Oscillospiraceae bacterium]
MRIIIVGDGKVGYTLAEQLSKEKHDVVIVDKNEAALARADAALDVLCVHGNGASIPTLREAGAGHCDLLIAATTNDEMNMICCLLGRRLGAKHTVARIRDPEYEQELAVLKAELDLNLVINPERAAAEEIARLLRVQDANTVESFAHGRVEILSFRVQPDDPVVGKPLAQLTPRIPVDVLFCAMERAGVVSIPDGATSFLPGDTVYIVGPPAMGNAFFRYLGRSTEKVRSVIIIGGGRITRYLTRLLDPYGMSVKIIELNPAVADALGGEFSDALVIRGDGTEQDLLLNEGLEQADAFVALTDRDEENLMAALFAHQRRVPRVITKINRMNYSDIIHTMGIDCVITPKMIAANSIERYVRALSNSEGSAMETLYRILGGKAEAMEFGVSPLSRLHGQPLRALPLKKGVLIAALARGDRILIPRGDTVIQPGDHVIVIACGLTVMDLNDLLEGKG